jgi:hypothetical protein
MSKKHFGRRICNLIAALRGLPLDRSMAHLKPAKPLGVAIASLLRKHSMVKISPARAIQDNWEAIVGHGMAFRCRPIKIVNGDVLIIGGQSGVIRSELQLQKSKILENLHALPICEKISDIRFVANA